MVTMTYRQRDGQPVVFLPRSDDARPAEKRGEPGPSTMETLPTEKRRSTCKEERST
eukprot:c52622_g1_i1 orf=105-272(+)